MTPLNQKKRIDELERENANHRESIGELCKEITVKDALIKAKCGKIKELDAKNVELVTNYVDILGAFNQTNDDNAALLSSCRKLSNEARGWRLVFSVAAFACALGVLTAIFGNG